MITLLVKKWSNIPKIHNMFILVCIIVCIISEYINKENAALLVIHRNCKQYGFQLSQ